jgi:hypothetical protein
LFIAYCDGSRMNYCYFFTISVYFVKQLSKFVCKSWHLQVMTSANHDIMRLYFTSFEITFHAPSEIRIIPIDFYFVLFCSSDHTYLCLILPHILRLIIFIYCHRFGVELKCTFWPTVTRGSNVDSVPSKATSIFMPPAVQWFHTMTTSCGRSQLYKRLIAPSRVMQTPQHRINKLFGWHQPQYDLWTLSNSRTDQYNH